MCVYELVCVYVCVCLCVYVCVCVCTSDFTIDDLWDDLHCVFEHKMCMCEGVRVRVESESACL